MGRQNMKAKVYDTGPSDMLPGIDCIGAGYNPFRGYASPNYICNPLFDWPNQPLQNFTILGKTYQLPVAVSATAVQTSEFRRASGETINSYQENLATSVKASGNYLFFSGSVSVDFASSELTKTENAFSRIQQTIHTYTLRYTIDSSSRSLLTSKFRTTLDNLDVSNPNVCKAFLDSYGSHVLTGIIIGGRALRTSSTNKTTLDSTYSLEETAEASFAVASGGASLEASNKYSNAVKSFNQSSQTIGTTEGGDPGLGSLVFKQDEDNAIEWQKSVIENPVFVDFHDNEPLMPIWDLCDSSTEDGRKIAAGLFKYFDEVWSKENTTHIEVGKEYPEYYSALTVAFGENNPTAPGGYEMIKTDLNSGTDDMPLYLCYRRVKYDPVKTPAEQQSIWRVVVFNEGKNYRPSAGLWHVIPTDLNLDAGGDYLYLAYKTQAYDPESNILDFEVVAGEDSSVPVSHGYVKVDKDLNKGAWGDFVYLAYKKSKFDPSGDFMAGVLDDINDITHGIPYPGT